MDSFSNPAVERIVVMTSSQVGKTTILENCIGYHIDQDPSPMLVVQPTIDIAEAFSKDRLAPMLRDTPALKHKVKDVRSRDANNTTMHKMFPGGHITMAGGNSAASLASRPIRIVLCDEVDRYPPSAGTEGDPVDLAFKRATTFWNRKLGMFSTPTIKGASRIETAYEESDQRKYYVPCIHCDSLQILQWHQVKWPDGMPLKAIYVCEFCGCEITDRDKLSMIQSGKWQAQKEFSGIAGFWLNELYSPWVSFGRMASNFLHAKHEGREALKVFLNTSLAVTWEEEGETVKDMDIYNRREDYGVNIPLEAATLTAGVDVQGNRIECEVVAWGKDEESWGIEYKIFQGDPARMEIWNELYSFLKTRYTHESGTTMGISVTCIDTGGHHTQQAYNFVKSKEHEHIYGIKGANKTGEPIWPKRASKNNKGGINLYVIGVDAAKDLIHNRLKLTQSGAGYMHFPLDYDEEYFQQLTAERVVYEKGLRKWMKRSGARNEALDVRVYATAALERMKQFQSFNLNKMADRMIKLGRIEKVNIEVQTPILQPIEPQSIRPQRRIISQGIKMR